MQGSPTGANGVWIRPMEVTCPHCGEPIDVYIDPGGGTEQQYVEDCSVCCRPILLSAEYSEADGDYRITASPDI